MQITHPPDAADLASTGLLSLVQRWHLTLAMVWARAKSSRGSQALPRELHSALGDPAVWNSLKPPSGALAAQVWKHAAASQPTWLNNHCLRTYAWGQALGLIGGLAPDAELLFAAAALHDMGLTPVASQPPHHCFAMRGAQHARRVLSPLMPPERAQTVAQAIERHLDMRVDAGVGVEAHLLQAGAMVDVIGRGASRVPGAVRQDVLTAHPRLQMKHELCLCMRQQSEAAPNSRAGLYVRRFGFLELIRRAPFD